ncbi:MAG: hypothetical protein M0004_12520 [Actinomycetota bacterium]|nr:hypothetical protein [Actinomycetota bacterium]
MRKSRRWLTVLLAAGLVGLGASSGTFATFNATTTNLGNTFATGSLTLSNTANAGTACFSFNGTSNANSNCLSVLTLDNTANYPGGPIALGAVTVANGGTINAARLDLYAQSACVDSSATTFSNVIINQHSTTIFAPSGIYFDGVSVGMTVTATASSLPSGTTVSSVTRNSSNDITAVTIDQNPTATVTTTVYFTLGSLSTTATLCSDADVFVEEYGQSATSGGSTTSTDYTNCWYGACPTVGQVASELTGTASATAQTVSLSSSGLSVTSGDSLAFVTPSGSNVIGTSQATGTNQTSISVVFPTTFTSSDTLPAGTAVVDLTTQPSGTGKSLATFTSTSGGSGGTSLLPLTAPDTQDTKPGATELAAAASRSFLIGVYLPSGGGNTAQDALASFGLTWQISQ